MVAGPRRDRPQSVEGWVKEAEVAELGVTVGRRDRPKTGRPNSSSLLGRRQRKLFQGIAYRTNSLYRRPKAPVFLDQRAASALVGWEQIPLDPQ